MTALFFQNIFNIMKVVHIVQSEPQTLPITNITILAISRNIRLHQIGILNVLWYRRELYILLQTVCF